MAGRPENNLTKDSSKNEKEPSLRNWKDMVFASPFANLRIVDPENAKHVNPRTGETIYGIEMIFKATGGLPHPLKGMYHPKSRREAQILLEQSKKGASVRLLNAPIGTPEGSEVVGTVVVPVPQGMHSAGK